MGMKIARKHGESIFVNDAKITVTMRAGRVVLDVECPPSTLVWRSNHSKEAKNEVTLGQAFQGISEKTQSQ